MDLFITNVPDHVNHVEFRLFIKDKLRSCAVRVFDVFKQPGKNWGIITVADPEKGRKFLARHGGFRSKQPLTFKSRTLGCRQSNKKGQPDPLKVVSLLQKEEALGSKKPPQTSAMHTSGSSQPIYQLKTLMAGVWNYGPQGELVFDQKYKDLRTGSIICGKSSLVIYLQAATHAGYDWHGRIDIPYSILEHTIPAIEDRNFGSITFTLKSPPKIYEIVDAGELHRYTGVEASDAQVSRLLADLSLAGLRQNKRARHLERLCSIQRGHDKTSALCMVYKLLFPNLHQVYQAWAFIKDFSVPEKYCWKTMATSKFTRTIESDLKGLEHALLTSSLSFAEIFQTLALVYEGTITPVKMQEMIPLVSSMSHSYGSKFTALAIRRLGRQIPTPGPDVPSKDFSMTTIGKLLLDNVQDAEKADSTYYVLHSGKKPHHHLVLTYKATITPAGIILRGPDWSVSNRILRKYSQHSEYFMRVFFADEDGMSVFHDPKASQDQVYERFRQLLRDGIFIGERHFEFLGFSHASLRCHQTWFMARFEHEGQTICARDVIQDLGDFTNIHCSAKCAARIGQAFSDTIFSVPIPSSALVLETKPDVERNNRCFSDGCGTLSLELLQKVWKSLPPDRRQKRPTVLQIRFRGAKGVLSLDSSLPGQQLHIRKSMTKYIAKEGWRDLELCGEASRPLKMFLNHQFVQILEDLGVPLSKFTEVQDEACKMLEMVIKHPLNAANFLDYSHSGVHARIPRLIQLMHFVGLSFQADRFLTDIVEVAAMSTLRSLKYRARIPLEKGYLLYGIMDETNTLKEGQVYVATEELEDDGHRKRSVLLGERVVVTRAPALHPGDVQIVTAVDVPDKSPLRTLQNCIVFSQQGARDLPSQLSGGDLDGDLFHIIFDTRLIPDFTYPPADYTSIPPQDLGRPVEVNDIADFFIEFMNMDRLGQISNMHKIKADREPTGSVHPDCLLLAQLASDAVDFSKSGIPADLSKAPRGNGNVRPDFMAPGHNLVLNDLGSAALEVLEHEDIDEPDMISILDPDKSKFRYYKSNKVLGHLYRRIDEQDFFRRMKETFEASYRQLGGESIMHKLDKYVDREMRFFQWEHHREFAEDLREYYEMNLIEIMDTLRAHRGKPLTELEVVSGNILGKKERASTRHIRETNQEVQERFDRDVSSMIKSIVQGDEKNVDEKQTEALTRSIACFKISLETKGWENQVTLKSWKYVAASVCLDQIWRFRGGNLRPL